MKLLFCRDLVIRDEIALYGNLAFRRLGSRIIFNKSDLVFLLVDRVFLACFGDLSFYFLDRLGPRGQLYFFESFVFKEEVYELGLGGVLRFVYFKLGNPF